MKYREDWPLVKRRLQALWERELIDRCCISVRVTEEEKYPPIKYDSHPERILEDGKQKIENTYFGGEALPQIMLDFGTSGHALYYGALGEFTRETVWYRPVIDSWDTYDLSFKEKNILEGHLEIAEYLVHGSDGDYFVSMPDHCGTLDALANLRGVENLMIDLVVNKDRIKEAMEILNQGWKDVLERFGTITKKANDGGTTHGWMDTWSHGVHVQLQCDISVMLSPETFLEFVVPELEEQSAWADYSIYHLDGEEQIRHLDYLLGIDTITMIQWTDVYGQSSPSSYSNLFKKIQRAGKSLIIFAPPEDIPILLCELSSKGLYLHTEASSVEEAEEIVEYVRRHSRE